MGVATRVSEEEYLANPEWEKYEYLDGEVVEAYLGKKRHTRAQVNCAFVLKLYLTQNPIGWVGTELGCRLTIDEKVFYDLPDVCVVIDDPQPESDYLPRAPEFVVEIRSPGDSIVQIMRRMEHFFLNGTSLGWILLPEERSVLVVGKGLPVRTLTSGGTLDGGDVLPGLKVAVDDLFS